MNPFILVRTGAIAILAIALCALTYNLSNHSEPLAEPEPSSTQFIAERGSSIAVSRDKERDTSAVAQIASVNNQSQVRQLVVQADKRLSSLKNAQAAAQEAARQAAIEEQEATEAAAAEKETNSTSSSNSNSPSNASLSGSSSLPALLLTIRANESGGNYQAYNGSGCEGYGCGGAFQLHLLYADDWAQRYGVGEWAGTAPQNWPPEVQDKVALGLFYSTNPAGNVWCAWTEYC